jgi:hypothetical protein
MTTRSTRYAAGTDVTQSRSMDEIQRILRRFGATKFMSGWDETSAWVAFELRTDGGSRQVRMSVPMPDRNAREFTHTPTTDKRRSPAAAEAAWEQAGRQTWRSVTLLIKAKLDSVAGGISTVEREFLADIVTEDGRTVAERVIPALGTGQLELLPGPSSH